MNSTWVVGPLERWLLPLGKEARGPRGKAMEEVEDKGGFRLQAGERGLKNERKEE